MGRVKHRAPTETMSWLIAGLYNIGFPQEILGLRHQATHDYTTSASSGPHSKGRSN
jgi:hypothetical protein